jgi:hypothetical protein
MFTLNTLLFHPISEILAVLLGGCDNWIIILSVQLIYKKNGGSQILFFCLKMPGKHGYHDEVAALDC